MSGLNSFKYLFIVQLLCIVNVFAEDIDDEQKKLNQIAAEFADNIHGALSENVIQVSNIVDNFFVSERTDDEGSRSRIVVSYLATKETSLPVNSEYLLKIRLHLPKTQNKLRLVIESSIDFEQNETDITDNLQALKDDAEYSTALQFIFSESDLWQLSTSAGVRFSTPINPFVRLRLRRSILFGQWESRITQTVSWFNNEKWSETTRVDFERKIDESFFFRVSSKATVSEEKAGLVDGNQNVSLFQRLTGKKALVYSIGADANLRQPTYVSRYYTNTRYRHNFYKKWAFYEVI